MHIYFISGHINITEDEFNLHYVPILNQIIKPYNKFVIGNANGTDSMSLDYLLEHGILPNAIKIFHHGSDKNHSRPIEYYKKLNICVLSDFQSYTARDTAMTYSSDIDVAWVRSKEETKKLLESLGEVYRDTRISGTEKNLMRRKYKNKQK